ncbi:MAG: hypothetical protein JO160_05175 [Candidatus Eremiobacteraeota bacterium]|nr:hypothetical protein [Candidatus Eremiobacteraeota bacterium]
MTAATETRVMGSSLASLVLHALAALLIPALAFLPSTAPPVETISFVRVTHIAIVPKPTPRPQPRPAAPIKHVTVIVSNAVHVEMAHVLSRHTASPPPLVSQVQPAAPTVASEQHVGTGSSDGSPAPQATAKPVERSVASVGGHSAGGYLPFTAEQPDPVLDAGVRKQLEALDVHVTLVVTVNEDGKTEQVVFQPPIDPKLEKQIEALLADAPWDPAVCGGGISCEGQATIKL